MIPLTVVIPWSTSAESCPHRRAAKAHVLRRVAENLPGATVAVPVQAEGEGEWNKPRLVNAAVADAKTDAVLVLDADICLPWPELRNWLETKFRQGAILQPFSVVVRLPQFATNEAYQDRTFRVSAKWPTVSVLCGGAFVCHRTDYLQIGGMDERYTGWGGEDVDLGHRAKRLLWVETLRGKAWHLYHPRPPELTTDSASAARNRLLKDARKVLPLADCVADTQNPHKLPGLPVKATKNGTSPAPPRGPLAVSTEPPPPVKGERAVLCACNAPFARYAAGLIHSVLTNSPGWRVHLFATNVPADVLALYPFRHDMVTIHAEQRQFGSMEDERCYMNSRRFLRYREFLEAGHVGFALMLDVDQLVLRSLDQAVREVGSADMGLIFRPQLNDRRRAVMAGTIAVRNTPASLRYWREYEACLPPQTWYADQLAMIEASERLGDGLACVGLAEPTWNSYDPAPPTVVLCTRGEDKFGGNHHYQQLFGEAEQAIEARRAQLAAKAPQTALVWVVFGTDGQRLDAVRKGMAETLATVGHPGAVLLIEASQRPALGKVLAEVPGGIYRHIVPGPRSAGVWQKEAMWEIARHMLRPLAGIRYAVFLDADCTPTEPDFFARVEALHESGVKVSQPWRRCTDTVYEDIGGVSCCWRATDGGGTCHSHGAQPGFCWSFDLQWLASIGGFPCREPLGGGDTMLMHLIFDPEHRLSCETEFLLRTKELHAIERQPPAALNVDLRHHSHGPRKNRQYQIRHAAALATGQVLVDLHVFDLNGMMAVLPTPEGDAWLRYLARRAAWTGSRAKDAALWQECLATPER